VFLTEQCAVSKVTTKCSKFCHSAFIQAHNSFATSLITVSTIRCAKSAQKSATRVCQVATVVMETTQLVLRQSENFYGGQLRIK